MGVKLDINTELISYLAIRNYSIDDLFVVYCINNDKKELLKAHFEGRNSDQKIALFQRFERKLLIIHLSELEEFDVDNYTLSDRGELLLSECLHYFNELDSIISQIEQSNQEELGELDKLVDEYLEIYPKGRNKSGETLRSNRIDVKHKMNIFIGKYKYDKDIILKATKNYIQQQSITNYEYCSAAMYFISKQGFGSKLANECENILSGKGDISSFTDQLM